MVKRRVDVKSIFLSCLFAAASLVIEKEANDAYLSALC